MKVRKGFVSNSSSSSFVCDICGEEASGWDLSYEDAGMVSCNEFGHTFCIGHSSKEITTCDTAEIIKYYKEIAMDEEDKKMITELEKLDDPAPKEDICCILTDYDCEDDWEEELEPSAVCPVCNYEKIAPAGGFVYLRDKFNLTDQQVLEMMKDDGVFDKEETE